VKQLSALPSPPRSASRSATLIAEFRVVERILYPYLVRVADHAQDRLAPVLLVWFGFGLGSKTPSPP